MEGRGNGQMLYFIYKSYDMTYIILTHFLTWKVIINAQRKGPVDLIS